MFFLDLNIREKIGLWIKLSWLSFMNKNLGSKASGKQ